MRLPARRVSPLTWQPSSETIVPLSKKVFLSLLILCVWASFLVLKVKNEYRPPAQQAILNVQFMDRAGAQEHYYGIYIQGSRVGHMKRWLFPTTNGYRIFEEAVMNIRFLEETSEMKMNTYSEVDQEFLLKSFMFQVASGKQNVNIKGEARDRELLVNVLTEGRTNSYRIALPRRPVIPSALLMHLAKTGFEKRQDLTIPVFDPSTMAAYEAGIHLIGWETVKVDGQNVRAFHVKTVFKGIELHAWMDEGGTVVKELSPLGLTVQKEASRKESAGFFDARLFSAIDTTGRIGSPRTLTYMKVRVETKDELKEVLKRLYDVQGDTIEVTTEAPTRLELDPRKLLGPSVFVNSDDEQILAYLNSIVAGKTNGSERTKAIMEWVFKNVRKVPTFSLPTAKDVFIKRAGDCNEHAVLFAAFARAAAIPCAIVSGMVYTMENFYYHAWNLVYVDGRWVPVDATFGQFPADATHIVLAAGDISDGVEIMQFLKNIKLHVKETR